MSKNQNFNSDYQNYPPGDKNFGHNSLQTENNSARRIMLSSPGYRGNVSMAWLPDKLMTKTLTNERMWAQHVKQFLILICGIETKSQEDMDKGGREHFIMSEYNRWVDILSQKFPDAAVNPWLKHTTGTRVKKIDGAYLFRNFQEGLRIIHRDLNVVWAAVVKEGISGKSKKEVWARFCYLYWSTIVNDITPDEVTPIDFDYKKVETKKWVFTFKYLGPCCEFLELGEGQCHEFLTNPAELGSRSTQRDKRKGKGK